LYTKTTFLGFNFHPILSIEKYFQIGAKTFDITTLSLTTLRTPFMLFGYTVMLNVVMLNVGKTSVVAPKK
jgi:hypothetical protein